MKIAIVGFDVEGKATYDYLLQTGNHDITICDQNPGVVVPDGVASQLGKGYLNGLDRFDAIVRTPGLQPAKILAQNPGVAERITSHINLFFGALPAGAHVIGVTGTKGKGTTSTLIAKMLEAQGKKVFLGGNIGVPALSFVGQVDADAWVVLELSSFQLIDCRYSPPIAVCLMIVAEHLNWHKDMAEYVRAKEQLFAHQQVDDTAIYLAGNELSYRIASAGMGQEIPYFAAPGAHLEDAAIVIDGQTICEVTDLKLLGEHNWQNACAAVTAVWQTGSRDAKALRSVLDSFSGLPHRLEFVRELDGVKYYDDSFGTTPETAMVALTALPQQKVIILGGADKGADYGELARAVAAADVRQVLVIGEQAGRIGTALSASGVTNVQPGGKTMAEIVANARAVAVDGDAVLLTPACTSFDMFSDYKDRGEQFKAAVLGLV